MNHPETLDEQEVYKGWLRIVRRQLRHPNGGVQVYDIVNPGSHSVCAVVLDPADNVVLVELYRFGQQKRLMELPAGAIDPGESYEEAIRREILEETGYEGELTEIGTHFIAAEHGVKRHVFVAQNCVRVADPTPEQSEVDEGAVVPVIPLDQFRCLVRGGELTETAGAFMALDSLGLL